MTIATQSAGAGADFSNVFPSRTPRSAKDTPSEDSSPTAPGLSPREDLELRRLYWIAQARTLKGPDIKRFVELRQRDRRTDIRPPKELSDEVGEMHEAVRRWLRFRKN